MPFAYYDRLPRRQQRIYDASDAIDSVRVPDAAALRAVVVAVARALKGGDRAATERTSRQLAANLLRQFAVPPVRIRVLAVRPSADWGELQGLYEPGEGRAWPLITVWMRTAHKQQVVAFRTYLRTLLHELGHHLDYELFELEDSYHTQGFYRRESSLFRQLTAGLPPEVVGTARSRGGKKAAKPEVPEAPPRPVQLRML